ncbi:MAG: PAS domain-containing protein [Deltaproteobacteria bacterium]|nr:PAS domain-containing protein [Deltaproteobacteria bacterium]
MAKKRALIWVLYPSYLFIIILSIVTVIWYASVSEKRIFLKQLETDLETRAKFIQGMIKTPDDYHDQASVDRLCKEIGKLTATRITIILPSGKVAGDSEFDPLEMDNHKDRLEFIGAVKEKKGVSTRYSLTLNKNFMYVGMPVYFNNTLHAVIRTSITVDIIDEAVSAMQQKIIFTGFIIAIFAALVCLFISRRISRPIEELRKNAEGIAKGEYRFSQPRSRIYEIENLHNAMKEMVKELEERILTITRQRNEIEVILSSMEEGIIAVDKDERIISLNRAAERIFSVKSRDAQGKSIQEAIRNRTFHDFISDVIKGSEPVEKEITLYPGEEKYINGHGTRLVDTNGKEIGALIVLNDITRLKRLENIRRDFVANVSHEIKTPVTAIKGFVETLKDVGVDSEAERVRFLTIISRHVNRLEAIIDELLQLSRLEKETESGDAILLENANVLNIIETAAQVCSPVAEAKQIKINITCEQGLAAKVNAPLLEQAVVNLLDNAVKYSDNNTKVHVKAYAKEDMLNIEVSDEGRGIEKEHLPRLFERFYRVDKARSRQQGGTGLGLAIVKHITQAHQGSVSVESAPGKGSTFTIRLPKVFKK